MSAAKPIPFVVGIASLYAFLLFISSALLGAGHGSDFFGAALLAPFSAFGSGIWVLWAGIAFWICVAILIAMRRHVWCRLVAGVVLVVHYFGVLFMCLQRDDWYYVGQVWRAAWMIVTLVVGAYLISQGFMWCLIARRKHDA